MAMKDGASIVCCSSERVKDIRSLIAISLFNRVSGEISRKVFDEVFAVEQRYAREILETTVDQIKVISCAADTRVGMETGNNGILITLPVLWKAGQAERQS